MRYLYLYLIYYIIYPIIIKIEIKKKDLNRDLLRTFNKLKITNKKYKTYNIYTFKEK